MLIQTADSIAASFVVHLVRLAVQHEQVDEQQRDDQREQRDPLPGVDRDVDELAAALSGRQQPG